MVSRQLIVILPLLAVQHNLIITIPFLTLHQYAVTQVTSYAVSMVLVILHHQLVTGNDDITIVEHLL